MLQITDNTTLVPRYQNSAALPVKDITTESGAVSVNSTRIVPDKNFSILKKMDEYFRQITRWLVHRDGVCWRCIWKRS